MRGTLLKAERDTFVALNGDFSKTGYTLTLRSIILRRKIVTHMFVSSKIDITSLIGKKVKF